MPNTGTKETEAASVRPIADLENEKARRSGPFQHAIVSRDLFVAINLFAALVHFLGLKAQGGDRAGVKAGDADRIAGFFAIPIGPVIEALERRVDLGNELALPVAGSQLESAIALG